LDGCVITQLRPSLVVAIPEQPEPGVLYVSVEYATTLHLCACGCGCEIVLGISPNDWKICWDGLTVSVSPSVGNWSLPCQSHYFIRRNRIRWAPQWSDEEIARARGVDVADKHPSTSSAAPAVAASLRRRWRRLLLKRGLLPKDNLPASCSAPESWPTVKDHHDQTDSEAGRRLGPARRCR